MTAEMALLRDEIERLSAQNTRFKKEIEDLKAEAARVRRDGEAAADTRIQKLQEQITLLIAQHDELHGRHTELTQKHDDLVSENEREVKRRKGLEDEVARFMKR